MEKWKFLTATLWQTKRSQISHYQSCPAVWSLRLKPQPSPCLAHTARSARAAPFEFSQAQPGGLAFSVCPAWSGSSQHMPGDHGSQSWSLYSKFLTLLFNSIFNYFKKNSFPCRWEAICIFHQDYLPAALVFIPHPNLSCPASHLTPAATGALGWNSGVQLLSSTRNSLFCCSDTMTNLDWGKILGEYIGEVGALGLLTHCSCLLSFFKWKHFLCRDAQPTA